MKTDAVIHEYGNPLTGTVQRVFVVQGTIDPKTNGKNKETNDVAEKH